MSSDAITQTKRPSVRRCHDYRRYRCRCRHVFHPCDDSGCLVYRLRSAADLHRFCMYTSGLMILEANLNYPSGSSFHTITKDLLGNGWSVINGLSIAFVLYILTYAYISAGGSMLQENLAARGLNITPR